MPRILNAYLDTDLPYRPDTTWAWDAGHSILDAVEVDRTTFQPASDAITSAGHR